MKKICSKCKEREIAVKVFYYNGIMSLLCRECAKEVREKTESEERVN